MSTNTVTTKQFESKLIEFINLYYDEHFTIEHIDKIRFTSHHITVYINADAGDFYYINYSDFGTFIH